MEKQRQRRWLLQNPGTVVADLQNRQVIDVVDTISDWFLTPNVARPFDVIRFRMTDQHGLRLTLKSVTPIPTVRDTTECAVTLDRDTLTHMLGGPHTKKTRYAFKHFAPNITIDCYEQPLGLVIVEWIDPPEDVQTKDLPNSLRACDPIEVTNTLTAAHIAAIPRFQMTDPLATVKARLALDVPMIVLTGGPCSGKSTILETLRSDGRIHVVPEVATILIQQLGVKPFGGPGHSGRFQTGLREVQIAFESLARMQAKASGKRVVVLDRGALDACAYIGGRASYYDCFRADPDDDAARYHAVVQLSVPPQDVYDRCRGNNAARHEDYPQARDLGDKIHDAWASHPGYISIDDLDWPSKEQHALTHIQRVIETL